MRKAIFVVMLLLVAGIAVAHAADAPDVAHGSEKVAAKAAHPGEEGNGPPEEAPKFLGISSWIWKLFNMVLFIGALGWLLGPPIKKAFAARTEEIHRTAEDARTRRAKADQLAADIQARLDQIEQDVMSIKERAQADGERQRQELIAAAEAEAQRILQNARSEVDNRLKHARHELAAFAAQLASDRAEQILRETITGADQQKLFNDSVREVAEVQS